VSHQPERKENDCLNCGTIVHGKYCHQCGQENVVTHHSFFGMAKHFLFDIFHFDGKFFDTLGNMFRAPGKVPLEYIAGKRMKYLDPIRMYLFTSAVFFLVFFTMNKVEHPDEIDGTLSKAQRMVVAMQLDALNRSGKGDSNTHAALNHLLDSTRYVYMSTSARIAERQMGIGMTIPFDRKTWYFQSGIDSTRMALKIEIKKKSWFDRMLSKKFEKLSSRYDDDPRAVQTTIIEQILHRIPLLIFISLPFFGLLLKLLYRDRRNVYYSDHMVFTLYHYIFSFLLMLVMLGLFYLRGIAWKGFFGWLIFGVVIYWNIYLYKGLRRFYGQGRLESFGKYVLLLFLGLVTLLVLAVIIVLITAIQL
jgi:hypothetical protein